MFAASGWQVRKRNLSYTEVPATAKLAGLMRIAVDTPLAEHAYALDVAKNGRTIAYASIVEIHHPSYLRVVDLVKIYGPVDAEQSRAPAVSALRSDTMVMPMPWPTSEQAAAGVEASATSTAGARVAMVRLSSISRRLPTLAVVPT